MDDGFLLKMIKMQMCKILLMNIKPMQNYLFTTQIIKKHAAWRNYSKKRLLNKNGK